MPIGNFDRFLVLNSDGRVMGRGPLDPDVEDVLELCAWVVQRYAGTEAEHVGCDAAATEMALPRLPGDRLVVTPGTGGQPGSWEMRLEQVEKQPQPPPPPREMTPLVLGPAFAIAMAKAYTKGDPRKEVVEMWAEPVTLVEPGQAQAL
jgi:hypothetical protein